MKAKWNEPTLLVDDHHGIYMGKIAYEILNERYKKQISKVASKEDIETLMNVEDEWHHDVCDRILANFTFTTETGQKFCLAYAEGGIWAIPNCFRGKKLEEFFGN
jgi:hypothetical protein